MIDTLLCCFPCCKSTKIAPDPVSRNTVSRNLQNLLFQSMSQESPRSFFFQPLRYLSLTEIFLITRTVKVWKKTIDAWLQYQPINIDPSRFRLATMEIEPIIHLYHLEEGWEQPIICHANQDYILLTNKWDYENGSKHSQEPYRLPMTIFNLPVFPPKERIPIKDIYCVKTIGDFAFFEQPAKSIVHLPTKECIRNISPNENHNQALEKFQKELLGRGVIHSYDPTMSNTKWEMKFDFDFTQLLIANQAVIDNVHVVNQQGKIAYSSPIKHVSIFCMERLSLYQDWFAKAHDKLPQVRLIRLIDPCIMDINFPNLKFIRSITLFSLGLLVNGPAVELRPSRSIYASRKELFCLLPFSTT